MSREEASVDEVVAELRRVGLEPTGIEVKAAARGLPRSVPETLSAFANGSGGTLLLGLSEEDDFKPVAGFDAPAVREALAQACHEKVQPPVRAAVEVEPFEGAQVVRVDVDELDPVDKPCFVTTRGEYTGSFIRGGDGDRRLTRYEVTQLLLNRTQPTFDQELVPSAGLDDFDAELVAGVIDHASQRSPRAFGEISQELALQRLGAAAPGDGQLRPTLAGLLALGAYPQQYFPQLFIAFVALPGIEMGELGPGNERFLDNATIDGPIPAMVAEVSTVLRRNMSRAAVIRGMGREDRYDYPLEVIRELVVNAVMHRDYSPEARGAQVQVELYPDRLVVKSPGGLYGSVTADDLGTSTIASSSRNAALAKLLGDVPLPGRNAETIVENRGSGLVRVVAALKRAGMSPPEFDVTPAEMRVTVPRNALLSPETIDWIGSLGIENLSDEHHLALAMMRNAGRASSAMMRAWGVDARTAGRVLRELVDRGAAVRRGGKRYASYHLASETPHLFDFDAKNELGVGAGVEAQREAILQAIRAGHATARELVEHLGLGYQTVVRRLNELIDGHEVERTRPPRSSKQSYRLAEK